MLALMILALWLVSAIVFDNANNLNKQCVQDKTIVYNLHFNLSLLVKLRLTGPNEVHDSARIASDSRFLLT